MSKLDVSKHQAGIFKEKNFILEWKEEVDLQKTLPSFHSYIIYKYWASLNDNQTLRIFCVCGFTHSIDIHLEDIEHLPQGHW